MYKDIIWLNHLDGLPFESAQALGEGKKAEYLDSRIRRLAASERDIEERQREAAAIYDEIETLPVRDDFPYHEPETLDAIRNACPTASQRPAEYAMPPAGRVSFDRPDKIRGAWLGRTAGCLLGKPVEGWKREKIIHFLKDTGNHPIRHYLSSDVEERIRETYEIADTLFGLDIAWINNVRCMPEDDDMNYTVLALEILEQHGSGFTMENVADAWLSRLPAFRLCTAERAAYRNFLDSVAPPGSARRRNPFREWIGAQIRADLYGYVTPGDPRSGAAMAYKDASVSHVKNGVYGAMMAAAMLSAAGVSQDAASIVSAGLSQIPAGSRLAEALRSVLEWHRRGVSWEEAVSLIHTAYDEEKSFHWGHVIPNAMIVAAALLYGESDYGKTVGLAVMSGFDTDCNGATAGSVMGMVLGAAALPEKWTAPLHDCIKTGISGACSLRITDLADRTAKVMERMAKSEPAPKHGQEE